MTDVKDRSYGLAAVLLFVLLLWFGCWTIICNALVISGTHYKALVWGLGGATILAGLIAIPIIPRIFVRYSDSSSTEAAAAWGQAERPLVAIGLIVVALAGGLLTSRFQSSGLLIAMTAILSFIAWRFLPTPAAQPLRGPPALGILFVFVLLCLLYYFGHWSDWDDANYINMALGAQHTKGLVFQFDTMLGDGPGPIHLPTYKFHSFELLGAVLSSLAGLSPISVIHLVLPAPALAGLTLVLYLVLKPLVGQRWVSTSVFMLAFLYAVTESLGAWGMHGVLRFYQGKGFLVTALVPASAALTARWFVRRDRYDLVGLGLIHVCALGASANGLYVTPLASAFTAAAMALGDVRRDWRGTLAALLWLAPTLIYPVALAGAGVFAHLYLPSEVTGPQPGYDNFRFVTGWGWAGRLSLAVLPLAAIGFADRRLRLAAALYLPLAYLLVLSPPGWTVASLVTGNLGFRFFWAIPAGLIAGLVLDMLCRHVLGPRAWLGLVAALATLLIALVYNARLVEPPFRTVWTKPGLRVVSADYTAAVTLARLAPAGCNVLVPERVAVWLSTMDGAPHPAFVRSLYLKHYRFTMPAKELAVRWRLFNIVEGTVDNQPPALSALSAAGIHIGLVAASDLRSRQAGAKLADILGLRDRGTIGGNIIYWRGSCQKTN
jgi:hypothetical protein